MSRHSPVVQRGGPFTPINVFTFLFGIGSSHFHFPHVLFILLSIYHLLTTASWVWEEAQPNPTRGDGPRPLSRFWTEATPMHSITPLLVFTPCSLGMTHRLSGSCRQPGFHTQCSFLLGEAHDWSECVSAVPWQKEPTGLSKDQA